MPDNRCVECQESPCACGEKRLSDAYLKQQGAWYLAINEVYGHTRRIWREACGLDSGDVVAMRALADQLATINPQPSRKAVQDG